MNHYDTLGVDKAATEAEIKKAWRKASSKAHPDRQGGSTELQITVNKAYETLGDSVKRARYDETGEDAHISTPETRGRNEMLKAFHGAMVQDHADPIDAARKVLRKELDDQQQLHRGAEAVLAKLQRRRKQIIKTGTTGENILVAATDQLIESVRRDMVGIDDKIEVFNIAIKLLFGYKFQQEESVWIISAQAAVSIRDQQRVYDEFWKGK